MSLKRLSDRIPAEGWVPAVPATYQCTCGTTIEAVGVDMECHKCHALYNCFGQEVRYRHDDRAAFEADGGYLAAGEHWDEDY